MRGLLLILVSSFAMGALIDGATPNANACPVCTEDSYDVWQLELVAVQRVELGVLPAEGADGVLAAELERWPTYLIVDAYGGLEGTDDEAARYSGLEPVGDIHFHEEL